MCSSNRRRGRKPLGVLCRRCLAAPPDGIDHGDVAGDRRNGELGFEHAIRFEGVEMIAMTASTELSPAAAYVLLGPGKPDAWRAMRLASPWLLALDVLRFETLLPELEPHHARIAELLHGYDAHPACGPGGGRSDGVGPGPLHADAFARLADCREAFDKAFLDHFRSSGAPGA